MGYLSIIYYSAVIGVDREYLECAALEGATKMQQIRKIILPLISPVITIMVLLAIGKIFYSDFGLFYQVPMDSGPLYSTTNVISTYVYRGLMQLGDIGMSSAAGLYQSVVGFILVLVSNLVVRKLEPEKRLVLMGERRQLMKTREERIFQVVSHMIMLAASTACIVPFLLLIVSSFTDNNTIIQNGYSFFPKKWSLEAYRYLLQRSDQILRAYGITVLVTAVGTVGNLFLTTLLAYPPFPYGPAGEKAAEFCCFLYHAL